MRLAKNHRLPMNRTRALIPLALRAMKVDPALASSVFITTLTDVFGFLSFLGLGALFIRYLRVTG